MNIIRGCALAHRILSTIWYKHSRSWVIVPREQELASRWCLMRSLVPRTPSTYVEIRSRSGDYINEKVPGTLTIYSIVSDDRKRHFGNITFRRLGLSSRAHATFQVREDTCTMTLEAPVEHPRI